MVETILRTDPISSLGLPPPVAIGRDATVGDALSAVQKHGQGYVLIVDGGRPAGLMSETEVLMRVVARHVNFNDPVSDYMTHDPPVLAAKDRVALAIRLMDERRTPAIPIVDEHGVAVAVLRTGDIIHFLAEAFPAHILNLPPRPHQMIPEPEGA